MIRVVAKVLVKKDKKDAFVEACRELVQASRQDEGNIGYTLNVSVDNPLQFAFIENWRDQDALDAHMKQPHFVKGTVTISECADGEMPIEVFNDGW